MLKLRKCLLGAGAITRKLSEIKACLHKKLCLVNKRGKNVICQ